MHLLRRAPGRGPDARLRGSCRGRILFGDLNDPKSDVCKALASNYSIRRKPNLGTQPGVYYLI